LQEQGGAALAALAAQLEPIDAEGTRAVTEALEALAEATTTTNGS
jgi:tryptophanyl-tRNA synthetase